MAQALGVPVRAPHSGRRDDFITTTISNAHQNSITGEVRTIVNTEKHRSRQAVPITAAEIAITLQFECIKYHKRDCTSWPGRSDGAGEQTGWCLAFRFIWFFKAHRITSSNSLHPKTTAKTAQSFCRLKLFCWRFGGIFACRETLLPP